jgi:MFS family permease
LIENIGPLRDTKKSSVGRPSFSTGSVYTMPEPTKNGKLFFASFMTLIAAGIGFGVRGGGILGDWAAQFGFTKSELGTITGGGLTGFGVTIIICSIFADRLGYKPLLIGAFILHVLSAVVTLAATPVFQSMGKAATYNCLFWGMFLFALGNGLCEAVINPLVATIYSNKKTHYLNILHAGWPAGLILGGLIAFCFIGDKAAIMKLRWEINLAMFLIPTLIYGFLILPAKFPVSEAKTAGVKFSTSLAQFASPMLLFLLLLHALVGYVELGTDSWITDIMKNVVASKATLLFIYTSALMFVLRFFAGPIVEKINPLGLLFLSACLGCTGLLLLGTSTTVTMAFAAATVYGLGKTFLWPTMLGVVGERFPKGGALTMGTMGGIGMLSAGLLGGPGIGYKQDYYASEKLQEMSKDTYERYKSKDTNSFLFLPKISGLDGSKVDVVTEDMPGKSLADDVAKLTEQKRLDEDKNTKNLNEWWTGAKTFVKERPKEAKEGDAPITDDDKYNVEQSRLYGGRMALKWTAAVPATMALGYLILIAYFAMTGGYKALHVHGDDKNGPNAPAKK